MRKLKFIGESNLYFKKGNVYKVYKNGDKRFVINDVLRILYINKRNIKNFEVTEWLN